MTVPVADQERLSHILADDLQTRIQWAYDLEQEIATLSGGGLTSWGLASQATYVYAGDPNGNVTAVTDGDFLLDTQTPALWLADGPGTSWTQASGGGGGGAPSGPAGGDLAGTYPNPTLKATGPGATGPLGTAARIPVITIDAEGRVTGLSDIAAALAATGDATGTLPGALTLKNTGPGATGPLGTAVRVPVVTIDAQGRVTGLSDIAIALAATGDATGTLPGALTLKNTGPGATGPLGTAARTNTVTIDAQGRVTALSDQAIALAGSQITSGTVPIGQIPTGTDGTHVPLGGVITGAGPTGDASHTLALTYNAAGQLTAVTNNAIQIAESQVTSLVADLALKAPLASPALTGTPTAPTATPATNSTQVATTAYADAISALKANVLTPTAVKTATTYTAAAQDFVPCDTTSNAITVTLPNAPADKTVVGVKHVIQGGTNSVTIACAGSDVFNKAGGSTSASLPNLAESYIFQYKASGAIWYIVEHDSPRTAQYFDALAALAPTSLTALQTLTTVQAAQIAANQQAQLGYYVGSGGAISVNGATAGSSAARVDLAAGVNAISTLDVQVAAATAQAALATAFSTTVAAGSNGVATSTFAGAGVLSVASTTGFPTSGVLMVTHTGSVSCISYTNVSGNTFTGCTLVTSTADATHGTSVSVTMATSDTVVGTNADVTNPLWMILEIDTSGVLQRNIGSAAASPSIPTITTARVPQYLLYVPANASSIDTALTTANGNAKLIDLRVTRPGPSATGWEYDPNAWVSPNTTVAAGSNTVVTNTFAGSGTLNVASTTGFPTSGVLNVVHSGTTSQIYYTGTTSTTFTGCLLVGNSVTMSTSDVVRLNGFQVSSATDFSSQYRKSTRVRWAESGTVKYAAIIAVSFGSSLTTFTFGASTDAAATAAATPDTASNRYSYLPSPQGFPEWFNFLPVMTGYSGVPNTNYRFRILDNTVSVNGREIADGTSNATTKTYTTPGIPASTAMNTQGGTSSIKNNSANVGTPCLVSIATGGLTWSAYADAVFNLVTAWTASGSARVYVSRLDYEF